MGARVFDLRCIESDVATLMQNVRTPLSLEELETAEYTESKELDIIDRSFCVSVMRYGKIYGFEQEQRGARVQNLFPIKKHEGEQISSSSNVMLEMHTETAFHPWRSETLCILCVREDERAGTVYAVLDDFIDELDDETIELLHLPLFRTTLDQSFRNVEQPDAVIMTPVLFNNGRSITYDRALMKGETDEAQTALDALSDAIDKHKKTVYLKTGQILAIDNTKVIHGRTPFTPRYDGTDRWLKRAMIRHSLVPTSETRADALGFPIITTKF